MRVFVLLGVLSCVPTTAPVVVPPTKAARPMNVEFVPDKVPTSDDLYVCSPGAEGKLWCVEYELFLRAAEEERRKNAKTDFEL